MKDLTIIILADRSDDLLHDAIRSIDSKYPVLVIATKNQLSAHHVPDGVKVINAPNTNNFSEMRNVGFFKANSEWVFFLDSDEILSKDLLRKIPELINTSQFDGFWISRKTYISEKKYLRYGLFYPDYQLRLIRRKAQYLYSGAVHEQINIPQEKTTHIKVDLIHHPRNPKYTSFKDFKNLLNYMNIQSQELRKSSSSRYLLFMQGIFKIISLFIAGYIRGKGFLDGWDGFRAHVMLSISVGGAYIMAATKS